VELYLDNTVRAVVLEAKTGEHSARMTAMTAASDNTEQLLAKLNLELNHARQSAITTEISEIVGGANALQSGKEGKRG
jgi:F-type H+-transporting ATPase subunit gamma